MSSLFWQKVQWDKALGLYQNNRFPNALCLSGLPGLGKKQFAQKLGQWILCTSLDKTHSGASCDRCQSCQWMQSQAHPEWLSIAPLESGSISIDQIREVIPWMQLTPHWASKKWVFIHSLDQLTPAASHALLKMLEEPSVTTSFIVETPYKERLVKTILSRLTFLNFTPPLESDTQAFFNPLPTWALRMAKGAPLKATELSSSPLSEHREEWLEDMKRIWQNHSDIVDMANRWIKKNTNYTLYLFYYWLIDLIYILVYKETIDTSVIINLDELSTLQVIAKSCQLEAIFRLLDQLQTLLRVKNDINAANDQLGFESLLIEYAGLKE